MVFEMDEIPVYVDRRQGLYLMGTTIDYVEELTYYGRQRVHNLKYYTWIEQQGRNIQELDAQWHDHDNYWYSIFDQVESIDELITDFNISSAESILSFKSAKAISGSIIQNSARCRLVLLFSARKVGPKV